MEHIYGRNESATLGCLHGYKSMMVEGWALADLDVHMTAGETSDTATLLLYSRE